MNSQELFIKAARAIESAKLLFTMEDFDGACNRAYYAMFDAARALLLLSKSTPSETIKTHGGLISAFSMHFVKTGLVPLELGKTLNRAEDLRLIADYSGKLVDREEVKWIIEQAEIFVSTTKKLSTKISSS